MLFVCYPKCTTCQKARRFLEARGASFTVRDIKEERPTAEAALERVKYYRSEGRSLKEAAKLAAADTGYSKNELYELALRSKD